MDCWYAEGLRFSCTRCGDCCTGAPGYVWVEQRDIEQLAALRGITPEAFLSQYVRSGRKGLSLVEQANGDCIFWSAEEGCTVYEARPPQCRTFPFWRSNLANPWAWELGTRRCPGTGAGTLHRPEDIVRLREVGGI